MNMLHGISPNKIPYKNNVAGRIAKIVLKLPAAGGDFPTLVLTPGLAFDREGRRLGRGAGYYDRFFAELDKDSREYTALGLCMDFQIVEKVPVEPNDKKMDGLLTGTELILSIP